MNKESPLLSICFNIFIPVLVLKNGNNWIIKTLVYFGGADSTFQKSSIINLSSITFLIALTFPITYFIYDFLKRKNINIISIFGFINILLTGGIGIFGEKFGLSKNWFIFKEGFHNTKSSVFFLLSLISILDPAIKSSSFLFDNFP